jgi:dihydrofolate reductase
LTTAAETPTVTEPHHGGRCSRQSPRRGEFDRGGWSFKFDRGAEGDRFKLDELTAAGALLLGRVTYDGFAAAWPSMTDDAGFADKMNGMPKYVVSTSLVRADWNNTTVIRGKVADEVEALKKKIDGDILVYGSGRLVQTLMRHDLVDEYRLMVYPVVLGGGNRLFGESDSPVRLRLTGSRQAGESLILTYRPDRAAVKSTSDEVRRAA